MTGAIIVGGLGLAAFLYWRSQQAQADALAAAQAAPGPGLVQKLGNTLRVAYRQAPTAAAAAVLHPVASVASGARSIVHSIGGLL